MKKLFSIIAMLLAVAMTTLAATPAFAATKKTLYISDMVMVSADNYEAAKQKLEKEGYLILDGELNPDLDEQIYIGYKTTEDPDEAITDMAVMNMNGPFSYSSYKQILEQQYNAVDEHMKRLIPSIVRYQENYDAGKQSAKLLREALNCYKEDLYHKTPVLMGDYLYSYDGGEEARKELTNIFMRGGSETMLAIEAMLAMASENTGDSLAERISTISYDEVENYYFEEYGTASDARKAMKSELGDTATYLYNGFANFREYLKDVEANYLVENANGLDIDQQTIDDCAYKSEYFKDLPEDLNDYINACGELMSTMTQQLMLSDVTIYTMLKATPYDDGTLFDFFMRDDDDVELSDFYPIIYCMNDAQRALLGNIGLKQLLLFTYADVDNADSDTVAAMREYIDAFGGEPESVYYGIDLSIFDDGVAFTDATVQHDKLTNDCWLADILGGETEIDTMVRSTLIATGLSVALGTTAIIAENYIEKYVASQDAASAAVIREVNKLEHIKDSAYADWDFCRVGFNSRLKKLASLGPDKVDQKLVDEVEQYRNAGKYLKKVSDEAKENYEAAKARTDAVLAKSDTSPVAATIIKNVSLVLMVITLAYDVYSIVHLICASIPEEEPIPHHIVTTVPTKYGDSYLYYAAAKNLDGGYADVNNHKDAAIGWLALYTTKDAYAGAPILADGVEVEYGKSYIKPGFSALHMFNEEAACNINDKTYSGSDKDAV